MRDIKSMNINRVEVIDHTKDLDDGGGRDYVFWEAEGSTKVDIYFQDDGKTLKVIIQKQNSQGGEG